MSKDSLSPDYEYVEVQYFDEPEPKPMPSAMFELTLPPKRKSRVNVAASAFNPIMPAQPQSFSDKYKRVQELDLFLDAINNRNKSRAAGHPS